MHASSNPFAEFHQEGMEALMEFAHGQFVVLEYLSALNFKLARSAFNDWTTYAKAALVIKDTPELSRLGGALALPALDRTILYSLGVCELGSRSQGEMARLVDAQANGFSNSVATGLVKLAQYAPAGSGMAVKAVKSAFDTVNSAFGSLTEYGMKTSEVVQTQLAAVTSSVADADAKSSNANSKTGKDRNGSKGSRQARKSTRRKAA